MISGIIFHFLVICKDFPTISNFFSYLLEHFLVRIFQPGNIVQAPFSNFQQITSILQLTGNNFQPSATHFPIICTKWPANFTHFPVIWQHFIGIWKHFATTCKYFTTVTFQQFARNFQQIASLFQDFFNNLQFSISLNFQRTILTPIIIVWPFRSCL